MPYILLFILFMFLLFIVPINRKTKVIGGLDNNNIFNLNDTSIKLGKKNTKLNIEELIKKYGNEFYVKYENIYFIIVIKKTDMVNNEGNNYYYIYTDGNIIYDKFKNILLEYNNNNNNAKLLYLNKYDEPPISGKTMLKFVLKFNKLLGVDKLYLNDYSSVLCEEAGVYMGLPMIKMLKDNKTFYMDLGFKLVRDPDNKTYKNDKLLNKNLEEIIKSFKEYTIDDAYKLIDYVLSMIKTSDKLICHYKNNIDDINIDLYSVDCLDKNKVIEECNALKEILKAFKNYKYIYEILLYGFYNKKCSIYVFLINSILFRSFYYFSVEDENFTLDDNIYEKNSPTPQTLYRKYKDIYKIINYNLYVYEFQ